jgi:hypothetical protein
MPTAPAADVVAPSQGLRSNRSLLRWRLPQSLHDAKNLDTPEHAISAICKGVSHIISPGRNGADLISGPQPPTSSAHAFRLGVLQHPQTLESFRQPDSMSSLSCESSDNQRYSIMPIDSTPEQQVREYHHRMQQSNAQEWQRLRQQQRGLPATPLLTSSVYPTRLPSFESSSGSGVGSMKSATISSSSKQESEEDANEHVEKCMRQ